MGDLDIDRNFLASIMQNMATALEKTKLVEDKVKSLADVVFGNENTKMIGLTEAHRQLLKEVSLVREVLDEDLVVIKKAIDSIDVHKISIDSRLKTVEEFVQNVRTLPTKLLLLIPLLSLLTQLIAQIVLPLIWHK